MTVYLEASALMSKCQQYRYNLTRIWNKDKPLAGFILLNPSTADASNDDPTIRRCISFAKAHNFGGIVVGNLFAFRTVSPVILKQAQDPIGDLNDDQLLKLAQTCQTIILAWGNHGAYLTRDQTVLKLLSSYSLKCFGITQNNQPKHPLYLPKACNIKNFT